jgi:hypothetical protein
VKTRESVDLPPKVNDDSAGQNEGVETVGSKGSSGIPSSDSAESEESGEPPSGAKKHDSYYAIAPACHICPKCNADLRAGTEVCPVSGYDFLIKAKQCSGWYPYAIALLAITWFIVLIAVLWCARLQTMVATGQSTNVSRHQTHQAGGVQ